MSKKFIKLEKDETIKTLTEKVNKTYPKMLYNEIIKLKKEKQKKLNKTILTQRIFLKRYPHDNHLDFKDYFILRYKKS